MSGLLFLFMLIPYLLPVGIKEMPDGFKPFPDSRYSVVNGVKLHYRLFEPAETKVKGNLLFVHGFSGSTFSWRYNLEFFMENGFRVVAVDLPAYGFSDKKAEFNHSPTSRANLMWDFLETLEGDKWNLAGHSMGAAIVVAMAVKQPEKTENLVLVNGAYFDLSKELNRWPFINLLHFPPVLRWGEVIARSRFFHYEKIKELLASAYGETPDSMAVQGYLEPFLYKGTSRAIIQSFLHSSEIYTVNLEEIKTRSLIIWGDNDTWLPISKGERIHEKLKDSEFYIFDNCGHSPMETHYDEFNRLLLGFLVSAE